MRVLQVIAGLAARTGGPGVSVVESSLALEDCGVETALFSTDLSGTASAADSGRPIRADELPAGADRLDVRLFPARPPRRLAFSPALDRALAAEVSGYDIVHIHSLFLFPQLAGYRNARRRGVPHVISPRGALDPWLRSRGRARKALTDALWQRRALERAALLHVTSEDEAALIADIAAAVPRAVVPNGIRWAAFQDLPPAEEFRRRHLGDQDGPIVLNLGRISHKKGLDLLVRGFALAAREAPAARLVIAGPDDEGLQAGLAGLAAALGVGDRVTFTGMLRGDDKLAALAAADVWALSSHTENFGVAAVEALAAGVPTVISTAVNIAPEARAAGAAAVCEPTAEAFAGELSALLADEGRRRALGERGREFARRYDWAEIGPRLRAMYERALDG